MPAPRPTLADWLRATFDLFPVGRAWPRDPDSTLAKVADVVATGRARTHDRSLDLLERESFPPTATELLPDWERIYGLPDPCRPLVDSSLAERRLALLRRMTENATPTIAYLTALAAEVGYAVSIVEHTTFVVDVDSPDMEVGGDEHVLDVVVGDESVNFFRAGVSVGGDPLWTFPSLATLECVLRRAAQGHMKLNFIVPV